MWDCDTTASVFTVNEQKVHFILQKLTKLTSVTFVSVSRNNAHFSTDVENLIQSLITIIIGAVVEKIVKTMQKKYIAPCISEL